VHDGKLGRSSQKNVCKTQKPAQKETHSHDVSRYINFLFYSVPLYIGHNYNLITCSFRKMNFKVQIVISHNFQIQQIEIL